LEGAVAGGSGAWAGKMVEKPKIPKKGRNALLFIACLIVIDWTPKAALNVSNYDISLLFVSIIRSGVQELRPVDRRRREDCSAFARTPALTIACR
jgi:hypothetical protein